MPAIKADIEKTTWVLTNLISNAVRYSYEYAKVLITCKSIHSETGKTSIYFSVQDFGKGIDAKYTHKIFDRN